MSHATRVMIFSYASVSLLTSAFTENAAALNPADSKYEDCKLGIYEFRVPQHMIKQKPSLDFPFTFEGAYLFVNKLSERQLDEIEKQLFVCNDVWSSKASRDEIHADVDQIRHRLREIEIDSVQKELRGLARQVLSAAQLNTLTGVKSKFPELAPQVDALIADQRRMREESERQIAQTELRSLSGHQLVPAEVERAHELAKQYPSLSPDVDQLLAAAEELKLDTDRRSLMAREKAAAAVKIEQQKEEVAKEEEQQQLSDQLDAQNARIKEAARVAAFQQSLPSTCKEAMGLQVKLQSKEWQGEMNHAVQLSAAGDEESACRAFSDLSSTLENLRADLVSCSKGLEGRTEEDAKKISDGALSQAINIHQNQNALSNALSEMHCARR